MRGSAAERETRVARHLFGYGPSDFAMQPVGTALELVPGATGTVWDSVTDGTQITDLTDVNNAAITSLTADENAVVAFYGPDGVSSLYVDFGFGLRFLMVATDLGSLIDGKADLDGADFSGPVTLAADPTEDLEAATKAYTDSSVAAVSLVSGGTVAGDLAVNGKGTVTVPGAATGVSSLGRYGLKLGSSFSGSENTSDSTGRLELESYQKAQHFAADGTTYAHYGEVIRIRSRKHNSKQMIAWYGPTSYDGSGDPVGNDTAWFWMGAHFDPNDPGPAHGHWSVEAPDSNGDLQTRFEIRIWDPTTEAFGMDRTIAKFNAADVVVAQDNGALYMAAAAGTTKNLYFTNDTTVVSGVSATGKRWNLQADSSAESGSNVGTDFRIARYNDSGAFVDTALFIKRSTGAVGIGNITSPAAKLDVSEAGSRHTIEAIQTSSSSVSYAAYSGIIGLSTNRLFDGRVSGDASGRFVMYGDGKHEWGDGGAGGRDVNLYRSAANVLKTDDKLITAIGLGVGNSASATTLGSVTKKMEVFDASGTSLGFVPIYNSIT